MNSDNQPNRDDAPDQGLTTPPAIQIVQAGEDDAAALAEVLTRAFHTDPVSSWLFPDASERAELHASFFQIVLDLALIDGEVYTTPERTAAALWLDVDPSLPKADDEVRDLLEAACQAHAGRYLVLDSLLRDNHPQTAAHTYLPFIGVDPLQQRHGIGTALLKHRLAELDASHTPAYLTASNRWSQKLYQRLGFRRLPVTVQLPEGPRMWPMWREPAGDPAGV